MRRPLEPLALRLPLEIVKALRSIKAAGGGSIRMQVETALRDAWRRSGYDLEEAGKIGRKPGRTK